MCYAYRVGSGRFEQHTERDKFVYAPPDADPDSIDLTALSRVDFYEAHGWWMWAAWMPVGFLLLVTKRYAKKYWSCMHVTHAILGFAVVLVTLIWSFKILDYFEWKFNTDLHSIFGVASTCLSLVVGLSGTTTASLMQFYNGEKDWTPKEKALRAAKFHKISGYFMLFMGNLTVMLGV